MEQNYTHEPVLLDEVLRNLITDRDGTYLDATLGLGGHAEGILKSLSAQGKLIGTDMDPEALASAARRLKPFTGRFRTVRANFRNLSQVFQTATDPAGLEEGLAGALFDLGVSSLQLEKASRGFAMMHEGPLDMRLDPDSPLTAARIVNEWPAEQLTLLFREFGEERHAARIAGWIVSTRKLRPFVTTHDLKVLLERKLPRSGRIHPATKTFMALRIAVNQELENLTRGLEEILPLLRSGGRIVVISFHSLEDRIVKNVFRSFVDHDWCRQVVNSPICPSPQEVRRNPRARSAKLRAVEKRT
ncbi:16S rRNA (cytosine(1402)-N(4))-methyltransferase RsmH [Elusimicrobiota bacterium]